MKKSVNFITNMMSSREFAEYMLIAYENIPHRNLQLDVETSWWHSDRTQLEFFLHAMYRLYEKDNKIKLDCDFLQSGELTSCKCKLCTVLWKNFDNNHVRFKCKHCGYSYWIEKSTYVYAKDLYKKKQGKYNLLEYCHHCMDILNALKEKKKNENRKRI